VPFGSLALTRAAERVHDKVDEVVGFAVVCAEVHTC